MRVPTEQLVGDVRQLRFVRRAKLLDDKINLGAVWVEAELPGGCGVLVRYATDAESGEVGRPAGGTGETSETAPVFCLQFEKSLSDAWRYDGTDFYGEPVLVVGLEGVQRGIEDFLSSDCIGGV